MKKIIIVLLVVITQYNCANAQKQPVTNVGGWHKIGDVTASFNLENESIMSVGNTKFKAIKLKVIDAPINIQSIDVYYQSGDIETIILKSMLTTGAETRIIELKNSAPFKKIVFTYKTISNSQQENAYLELYGLK